MYFTFCIVLQKKEVWNFQISKNKQTKQKKQSKMLGMYTEGIKATVYLGCFSLVFGSN